MMAFVSPDHIKQLAKKALSIPPRPDVAAKPGVETEAAARRIQRKEEHHHRKKYVGPRPLGGSAGPINAEPQVQHEYDSKRASEPDPEAEDERHGKGELGQKEDGNEKKQVSQIRR